MTDVENILNDDQFFGDVVDTPKEGIEQHVKWEELKSVIEKGKAHFLGNKWTHEKVDKASGEAINKIYTVYTQRELNEKGEKHVINLYSTGISHMVRIRDIKKLKQDIENDPIIKDQMASLGYLLVCTFGNFLAPVLVAAHMVSNLGLGDEQGYENEGYGSD